MAIDGGEPIRSEPMPAWALLGEDEKAAAIKVFDDAIATGTVFGYNGPYEQQYEKDFVDFMGGGFADGVNSGANAVFCSLGGLHLDAFSEVVVPPITDQGCVMPVVMFGCVPVASDADPRSYDTSAEQIEPMITERTRAIIIAHIGGDPVDMDPVYGVGASQEPLRDRRLRPGPRGEAQGPIGGDHKRRGGVLHDVRKASLHGRAGGIVYTQDEQFYRNARRSADRSKPFNVDAPANVVAGLNCNLKELSAAIGSAQLS